MTEDRQPLTARAERWLAQVRHQLVPVADEALVRDLLARVKELEAERDELQLLNKGLAHQLERRADGMDPLTQDLRQRADAAEAQLAALHASLREYGQHRPSCDLSEGVGMNLGCTCGLEAVLTALPGLALLEQIEAFHRQAETLRKERDTVLVAAKGAIAQFEAIKRHQHDLLIHGQTLESATQNWDEATLGQFIDFQPLIDAVKAIKP